MSFLLPSIIITIIAILLHFLLSASIAGWFVWGVYGLISLVLFIKSFTEYNSMKKGEPKKTVDIIGITIFPFITSIMGIVLIVLLFIDISKLHLLWLYPVVAIIFEFTLGRRTTDIVQPDIFKEVEKRQKQKN